MQKLLFLKNPRRTTSKITTSNQTELSLGIASNYDPVAMIHVMNRLPCGSL